MKKLILIIFLLAFTNKIFSQDQTLSKGDSLIVLSQNELISNPQQALNFAKEALAWYEQNLNTNALKYDNAMSFIAFVFAQNDQLDDAISLTQKRITRIGESFGDKSLEYAHAQDAIAGYYSRSNQHASAIEHYHAAAKIYSEVNGEDCQEYNSALKFLSFEYYSLQDFDSAIRYGEKYKEWVAQADGASSLEYASTLTTLCSYYIQQQEYQKAKEYGNQALDILEKADNGQSPMASLYYDEAMMAISTLYYSQEDYKGVIPYIKRQQKHYADIYGKLCDQYERTFTELGFLYSVILNDNEGSFNNDLERLDYFEEKYGKESYEYAQALATIAQDYNKLENGEKALECIDLAEQIVRRVRGTDSEEYNKIIAQQAGLMRKYGKHDDSKSLALQALKSQEKRLDKNATDYTERLYRIAREYATYEEFSDAIRVSQKIVSYYEGKGETDSEDYAKALVNLENYKLKADDFADCEVLLNKALAIRDKKKDEDYAYLLLEQSQLKYELGKYFDAIDASEEAISILNSIDSDKARLVKSTALASLSLLYSSLGNKKKAAIIDKEIMLMEEKYEGIHFEDIIWRDIEDKINGGEGLGNTKEGFEFVLSINDRILGDLESEGKTQTAHYGQALIDRGSVYLEMENYEKANEDIERGRAIQEREIGKNNLDYVFTLEMLATSNINLERVEDAKNNLYDALDISRHLLPENHPDILQLLKRISNLEARTSASIAERYAKEATYGLRDLVRKSFAQLNTAGRSLFWQKHSQWFQNDLPYIASISGTDDIITTAYDGFLLSKGLLLNTEMELSQIVAESNDKGLLNEYYKLYVTRSRLNNLKNANRQTIDSLEQIIEAKEEILLKKSKAYGDYTKSLSATWEDVRAHLKQEDAAIEFVSIPDKNTKETSYAAIVLRKEDKCPVWVKLFSTKELTAAKYKGMYSTSELSKLIWKPLNNYVHDKKNVYFAPDGELYNIGIEYLPHWEAENFVSNSWNLYRVSSTRQIIKPGRKAKITQAVVYGGLQYDTDTATLINDSRKYPSQRQFDYTSWIANDSTEFRYALNNHGVNYLPGTKAEADDIDNILRNIHITNTLYTGSDGTETSFKSLSGKNKNLLHIGTHGFYWTGDRNPDFLSQTTTSLQEDKAMTRSGLLFAGANNILRGQKIPENIDDGVLTAQEIALLDLREVDLAVLSACQSGLGDISGEGVFGLQRGFKKAGVKTLLMSLWMVNDEATRILMTQFYKNIAAGKSKTESLKSAQQYLREYEEEVEVTSDDHWVPLTQSKSAGSSDKRYKKVKRFRDAKYWAAFILLDALD